MGGSDDLPGSDADRVLERGESYEHTEHGPVEVTGIWRGIDQVDSARNTDETDVYIVRYSAEDGGERVDELTDTLDEFLEAIEEGE